MEKNHHPTLIKFKSIIHSNLIETLKDFNVKACKSNGHETCKLNAQSI